MIKHLVKNIPDEKIKDIFFDTMKVIKEKDEELYQEIEMDIYEEAYGCHFCEWLLEKATYCMVNQDGTKGGHWTIQDTTSVAHSMNITFDNFNEYDWNYVMNMMYSDYYGVVSNDVSSYAKLAKNFLMDKDGPKGKAFIYYMAMKNSY